MFPTQLLFSNPTTAMKSPNALGSLGSLLPQSQLYFSGAKYKLPHAPEKLEEALKSIGITPEILKSKWGISLWSLRQKDDTLIMKIDSREASNLDIKALTDWLQEKLQDYGTLDLKERSTKTCCYKGCKGCLVWQQGTRKSWLT
ncbi:MAG: hypothetical protein K2X66_08555 [Cyanobacteria bacterium]|nr:hypothetical protein [Cyanobacteriota bacterium]